MTTDPSNSGRFDGPLRFRRSARGPEEPTRHPPERPPEGGSADPRSFVAAALERVILIYGVLIFAGIALFGQDPDPTALADSNPLTFYSNLLFLSVFGLLSILNLKKMGDFLPYSRLLMLFLAVALFSTLWSLLPGVALRRVGTLMTTILVAAYLVMRFDFREAIAIIGHGVLTVVVLSVLAVIFMPHFGLTQALSTGTDINIVGTWKGVLPHKNSLGWICTAGVQIYSWRFLVEPGRRLRHAACLMLIIFVAAETRSSTAMITIILSIVLIAVLNTRSRRSMGQAALEWCVVGGTVLMLSIVLLNPGDVMALIGKSADMTGRVPLWRDVLVSIGKHPLLGYGYGTFWVEQNDERARIWALNPWTPPDAHNAYLEITLQLGLLGAVTATALLLVAAKRALDWCKDGEAKWAIYVATYLAVYVVTNVDETQLFRGGDFHCFALSFCYFTLIRAKRRRASAADARDEAKPGRPTLARPAA